MNAISPTTAPYSAHNSQPTFSPPQDLAKIPSKLGSGFIVTAAQNPDNPNTGWVKGFYVSNPEGNLQASLQQARDYVKVNYKNLDSSKVFISSPAEQSNNSSVLAPKSVLITGSDGKVSQIGRIQDAVSADRFQPLSTEEKSIFQKMGLSNLHPELADYNPLTDKHISPNSDSTSTNKVTGDQQNINKHDDHEHDKKTHESEDTPKHRIQVGDTSIKSETRSKPKEIISGDS